LSFHGRRPLLLPAYLNDYREPGRTLSSRTPGGRVRECGVRGDVGWIRGGKARETEITCRGRASNLFTLSRAMSP
jgi:hypothetical protein